MPSYAATLHIRPNLFHAVFDVIVFVFCCFGFVFFFALGPRAKGAQKMISSGHKV